MSLSRRLLLVGLLLLTYALVGRGLDAGLVDDAYIFLRYSRNLAAGRGAVFNTGERVEGYTSPLWMVSLAALGALALDLPSVARWLAPALGFGAVVLLLFTGGRDLAPDRRALMLVPCGFLVTSPPFVYWAWSGMETAMFSLALLACVVVFARQLDTPGPMYASGVLLLVAALTRLDALSVLPVFVAFIVHRYRRQAPDSRQKLFTLVAPLLLLGLHFLWRRSYYGSWLPNTYYAKVGVPVASRLRTGAAYGLGFAAAHAPAAALVLAFVWRRAGPGVIGRGSAPALCLATVAAWAAYVTWVGGDHFALFRFYVPSLPLLALASVPLIDRAAHARPWGRIPRLLALPAALVLVGLLNLLVYQLHGGKLARHEVGLARAWADVGRWLARNAPGDATLASPVVGAIPYFSGLTTYDMLGLTDHVVATRGRRHLAAAIGHQAYDTSYILKRRPTYIVYLSSGRYRRPDFGGEPERIDKFWAFAYYDLATDPRTKRLYDYAAVRMDDGRYIEMLKLKAKAP
jgi:arabinofuranosyltransferase